MSRGKTRPAGTAPPDVADPREAEPSGRARARGGAAIDVAIMICSFVLATLVAEAAGAANLGTSLSLGQIAFTLAAVYVLLRR